jgi:cytidyltransferase-like protein
MLVVGLFGDLGVALMEKLISVVTVGGTFDVLHKGHWFLLEEAFNVAERVLIGLTTDRFVARMGKSWVPGGFWGGLRSFILMIVMGRRLGIVLGVM